MSALNPLAAAQAHGALTEIDLQFARGIDRWGASAMAADRQAAVLAAAWLSRAAGEGHVCLDLATVAGRGTAADDRDGAASELAQWQAALLRHPAVGVPPLRRPLVLDGTRLYLHRQWAAEAGVAADLRQRMARGGLPTLDEVMPWVEPLFASVPVSPPVSDAGSSAAAGADAQRQAVARAACQQVAVISGGPGTGKTTTLAALLAVAVEAGLASGHGRPPRILMAAPTGKASARMEEAMAAAKARLPLRPEVATHLPDRAGTLHRLIGWRPDGRVRHDRQHPIPADLLVVDEASMVDLALMARVLDALPDDARLVLLGDRDQLASVEAGSVFADLCASAEGDGVLAAGYSRLAHSFRFGAALGIGRLARAIQAGDAEGALAGLLQGEDEVIWSPQPEHWLASAIEGYGPYWEALRQGEPPAVLHARFALFRLLAAHREGPQGVRRMNAALERALGVPSRQPWYPGRPVMVTANDYGLGLFNGDIGIAAATGEGGTLQVWFPAPDGLRAVPPSRLPAHETAWAMTVHKSQGSEFDRVALVLPSTPSPLVTRELVYTAITRARRSVCLWATEEAVRRACECRIRRHSGLAERLT